MRSYRILQGDVIDRLRELPDESAHCVVTSPPYWGLRDYGIDGQIGLEPTLAGYVSKMVNVFREVHRVLRSDGTCWVNMGDSYANDGKWGGETGGKQFYLGEANRKRVGREKRTTGLKPKDLCGVPWRLAFALQDDGWWLRQDIIWHKPNPMPESVTDRCTKAHEYIFLLSKSAQYYYDADAIKEPLSQGTYERFGKNGARSQGPKGLASPNGMIRDSGTLSGIPPSGDRNKRSVWSVVSQPFHEAHFATFPEELIAPCVLAGCPMGGIVLDPFSGSGTTGVVALRYHREYVGIELNPESVAMSERRISGDAPLFNNAEATC